MFIVNAVRPSSDLSRSIDRLFDSTLDRVFSGETALRSPTLDVTETEAGYNVFIDVPGVTKDDVKITIDGRRIHVSAQTQRDDIKKDGERIIHRERSASSFSRSFTLPEEVDQDASQAKLDSGVLSLTLAKKRAAAAKHLMVN
jgi:HSP20 family protein